MLRPTTLRFVGSVLGYLGVVAVLLWIAYSMFLGEDGWPTGGIVTTLERVPPRMWLLILFAGLPGFFIHLAGDAVEAQQKGISRREVQFRRHLKFQPPAPERSNES